MSVETLNNPVTEAQGCNMPQPQQEHTWLQQFVGEWEGTCECFMDPSQPAKKTQGNESIRSLGGFWVVADIQNPEMDFQGLQTLGYDPERGKYVGTWVDSFTNYLWQYEGSLDASGKVLTLETQGPCPMQTGKHFNFREVLESIDADHKIFSSSIQGEDGEWKKVMSIQSTRKK